MESLPVKASKKLKNEELLITRLAVSAFGMRWTRFPVAG
jgi:hypothetical protein